MSKVCAISVLEIKNKHMHTRMHTQTILGGTQDNRSKA